MSNPTAIELQNKYAYNSEHVPIFIDDAVKGYQGYMCMGCKRQMWPVQPTVENRTPHFRHAVTASKEKKCTFSDELYRHKLAIEYLLIYKRIKVPAVYKYSFDDDSPAILLQKPRVIEAYTAKAGVVFYENNLGQVQWTQDKIIRENHILFEPHVTFFDKNDNPILFVKIVTNHKVDEDQLVNLFQLQVNTVSVSIPRSSPQDIEQVFTHTSRTKWLYNYEEANTEYIRVSPGYTEGVPDLDEQQTKLFRESTRCRKAHIKNVIRRIRKSLESEHYRSIESGIRFEISRVDRDTEKLRYDIEDQTRRYQQHISSRNSEFKGKTEIRRVQVNENYENLERRYHTKKEELDENGRRLFELIVSTIEQLRSIRGNRETYEISYNREIQGIEREERDIERSINTIINSGVFSRGKFENDLARERESIKRIRHDIDRIKREAESVPREFNGREQEIAEDYRRKEKIFETTIDRERATTETMPEELRIAGEKLRERFEQLHQSVIEAIERRDFNYNPYLSKEYQELLSGERLLCDYIEQQSNYKRLSEIRKFIESGNYKNWI